MLTLWYIFFLFKKPPIWSPWFLVQANKTKSHCLSPLLTGPFNPISVASDSYLYELELTSQGSSLGDDWTNVPVIPGQFSVTELQRRPPRLISDDRNTEWRALPIAIVVSARFQCGGSQSGESVLSSAVEYLENIVSSLYLLSNRQDWRNKFVKSGLSNKLVVSGWF